MPAATRRAIQSVSTPIAPSHSASRARSSCRLVRGPRATNGGGSVQTCASGVSSAAALPDAPAPEAVAFDHDDAAQAGAGAEGGGRETDGAAADDEHVGTAVEVRRDAGLEGGEHAGARGVAPNGLPDGHAVRLRGAWSGGGQFLRRTADSGEPGRTLTDSGARSSMDRASDYGSEGWGFESLRAR